MPGLLLFLPQVKYFFVYTFVSKHLSAILSVSLDSFWVWSDSKSTLKRLVWFSISLDFCQIFDNFLCN